MIADNHRLQTTWQALFRSTRFSVWLLGIIIVSLAIRTAAYNYDLSLSAKDNAYNWNPHYKPVKQQPVKAKKPRALANITIPMAQTHSDIRKDAPLSKVEPPQNPSAVCPANIAASQEISLHLAFLNASPPDLCVLNAVFRI